MRTPIQKSLALATVAVLLVGTTSSLFAQNQPPNATNAQDEQVNIVKQVESDQANLTIFRSGDKSEINTYISKVVELKNAQAFEVVPHVQVAVQREKGTLRSMSYDDPVTGTKRQFIQIVTTPQQMGSVVETIEALDNTGAVSSEGDIKLNYRLKYRRASEVAAIIRATTATAQANIGFDDVTNTIYIRDSVSDTKRELFTAMFYDVPPPQVEFDVTIVEFDEDDDENLGTDWDAWKQLVGGQITYSGNIFEGGGDQFSRLDALITIDAQALASFLNYTVQSGTAEVVTRTTITATNNTPGIVSSLKRVPYEAYDTTFRGGASELLEQVPDVNAREELEGKERTGAIGLRPVLIAPITYSRLREFTAGSEGVFIEVVPTIAREMVTASVGVVVNSVSALTRQGVPIISERVSETTVTLQDGQPFHVSGINKETTVRVRKGIPILRRLPLIKYLFSVERDQIRRSKVFIVMTPHFRNQVTTVDPLIFGGKHVEVPDFPGLLLNSDTGAPEAELDLIRDVMSSDY